MGRVAIVTDSTADLPPELAATLGIQVVPLFVRFGTEEFKAGVDLTLDAFWARMTAPDAPFPATAAAPPGAFTDVYNACFQDGANAIVGVTCGSKLSATNSSAVLAAQALPDREIHVIDSVSASMGVGMLAILAAEMAATGASGAAIAEAVTARVGDGQLFVALDTLEYLRRGGRISAARAAIGTVLSVKPIITIEDGIVVTADRPRTRARARERVIELITRNPVDRIAILSTPPAEVDSFREEVLARLPGGIDPAHVWTNVIGPSVGPHIGPGALGAVFLRKP